MIDCIIGRTDPMIEETIHNTPVKGETQLSVCSFNVRFLTKQKNPENHWDNRKSLIVKHFAQKDYDIIGVQESTLPQSQYLQQEFGKLGYKYYNEPRDSPSTQECGIFMKANRYHVTEQFCDWINETNTRETNGYDSKHVRYFMSVVVTPINQNQDKTPKKCILVSNFHLDHIGTEARKQGIYHGLQRCIQVKQKMSSNAVHQLIGCILTGDFNEPEQCSIFTTLKENKIMRFQSMRVLENSDKSFTFNWFKNERLLRTGQVKIKPQWAIDHMFWWSAENQGLRATKFEVDKSEDGKFLSDHYGIVGTFHL